MKLIEAITRIEILIGIEVLSIKSFQNGLFHFTTVADKKTVYVYDAMSPTSSNVWKY